MVILRVFIFIWVLASVEAFADVESVSVICPAQTSCDELQVRAQNLLERKTSRTDIESGIEFLLLDQSIDKLSYKLIETSNGKWSLTLNIIPKLRISEVRINNLASTIDLNPVQTILPLKESGFYEADQLPESARIIKDYLSDRGFPDSKVNFSTSSAEDGVIMEISVDPGKGIYISSMLLDCDVKAFEAEILTEFSSLMSTTWNSGDAKKTAERLEQIFFAKGFWAADIEAALTQVNGGNILSISAKLGKQYLFSFSGMKAFGRGEILNKIRERAKSSSASQINETIVSSIEDLYDTVGHYKVSTKIRVVESVDKLDVRRTEFFVEITERHKTRLGTISLEGNHFIDNNEFANLIDDECSVLVCRGYYDRKFFVDFSDKLRRSYLKSGFVMANVTAPEIRRTDAESDDQLNVRYIVLENQKVEITRIEFPGVPADLSLKIIDRIKLKQGQPLDVTQVESDMNTALEVLREEGYFFARFAQIRDSKVVRYGRSFQTAQIVIPFELGKKTYFDGILVTGNTQTKSVVVEREVDLGKGDLVTSSAINRLRDRLVSLGLFANVSITPFLTQSSQQDQYWLSFLIEVKERNFGLGEIAPGYRTDLGPKASFQLAYNNVQGMNRTVSFKAQTNIRLNTDEFDSRRSKEGHRKPEFSTEVSYRDPWLFPKVIGSKWEFEFSASFKRQRFFGFDADIFRIGPRLTKQFGDHLTTSVRYQFEDISQFDATEAKDQDSFQIGGITPSISLDFRDNPIIPTKGAFFGLSWEFANPYFASQSRENLEINFNKLTSRNRFYYPVGNFVFALSISSGIQKNFADGLQRDSSGALVRGSDGNPLTKGYIPSIKVFRLDGIDNVRGFGDDEINRLPIGLDIGELRIQDTVTFINYKFEPRYYFSDLVAMGVFFDAAGIYVNHFTPLDVRTAVGLSAKLVTPVGSLDFDYGVKLRRQRYASGQRESFGRFHLSIGSF
tara:strand:+ start:46166 stop:49048 length:2883 start_codon:yes stop_codon:yes gene_type:complete